MDKLCLKFIFIGVLLTPIVSFAQNISLEPITIEKKYSGDSVQNKEYIYPKDTVCFSLEEVIDSSSSIDLNKRSAFGIQQDLSLRGSIFEDSSINLEGIEINDPQTGHFSLELPLTIADLEKAEIIKNSQKLNFRVKKPKYKGLLLKTSFGQHALFEELVSVNFGLKNIKNRFSVEHKTAKGGKQDTDFEIYNLSFNSLFEAEDKEIEFLFGALKKDFGAGNFYASSFPQEEEHITQRFFSLRTALKKESFDLNNTLYFRRHTDKFILNRDNPPFYTNYHTSYVQGLNSEIDFDNNLFFAFDLKREKVTSTNLGCRQRDKQGIGAGIKKKQIGNFVINLEAGLDCASEWDCLERGRLDLGYPLSDNLKLKFSYSRLWRPPSFTELYYSSVSDRGNENLKVQKSNNFELGAGYSPWHNFDLSLCGFLRDQQATIDWVKNISSNPWQAENVGDIKAYGFDFYIEARPNSSFLKQVGIGYTYLELDKNSPYNFSKYVFGYNRHKLTSNLGFDVKGITLKLISCFSNPVDRKNYTTVDLKIEKEIANFTLSLEGANIFNKDYQEMKDIEAQGRWYKLTLTHSF
ncbi:MAG: TonB-dependent receptor [Candidatus Omnitrophota bacterium]